MKHSEKIISAAPEEDELDDVPGAAAELELRGWAIGPAQHGQRLDRALAELVPEFSRSYLQQLIEAGAVTQQGACLLKPAQRMKLGEQGQIELRPTPQSQAFKPEAISLHSVYEDEHLRIIDKPAGLVVHPAPGHWSGTLLNGLLALDPQAVSMPRAGIVHRLDKDTSGLMLVARSRPVMDALVRLIALRQVSREYLALAHNSWQGAKVRELDSPIGRDPRHRLRMAVVDLARQAGKTAQTRIELVQNSPQGCLLRCALRTGRTHQIRVHLASIGHPLVADELYGGAQAAGLQRQALHAYRLALTHPVTGLPLVMLSPLPADFQQALVSWGLDPAACMT